MYFNNTLTKLDEVTITDSFGYQTSQFTQAETYEADVQPYSTQSAKKDYGLESDGIVYRCFLKTNEFKIADYIEVNNQTLTIVYIEKWGKHIEIVLGTIKNG
jgi:hypothetical protein